MSWLKKTAKRPGRMKRGAGILFVRNHPELGSQILLLLRSPRSKHGNTWGVPGGKSEPGESLHGTAIRETIEEAGEVPAHRAIGSHDYSDPEGHLRFRTFIYKLLDADWEPTLNWEHSDAKWFSLQEAGELDLHFCIKQLVDDLGDGVFGDKGKCLDSSEPFKRSMDYS